MIPDLIDIDIQQRMADLNVPVLRQPKFMALLKNFLSYSQKLKDDIGNNIMGSTSYSSWSKHIAYSVGDRVTAGRASYECVQPTTLGIVPTNTDYWYKIADDIIGLNERLNYNCQRMQLEYILNLRFNNVSSILPPYNSSAGNIYITTNPSYPNILWCARGNGNASGSFTAPNSSNRFYYCGKEAEIELSIHKPNYAINVPSTLLTSIGGGLSSEGKNIIMAEVIKYNAVGLTSEVVGYP